MDDRLPEAIRRLGIDADDTNETADGRVRAAWEGEAAPGAPDVERPTVRFDDVGGMESIKLVWLIR